MGPQLPAFPRRSGRYAHSAPQSRPGGPHDRRYAPSAPQSGPGGPMTSAPVEGTRPSDAERDRALAVLREGAGSGRLSHDTFIRRMNFVLRAQSRGELADAIRDLPRAEPRVVTWMRDL